MNQYFYHYCKVLKIEYYTFVNGLKFDGICLFNYDRLSRDKRVEIAFEDIIRETKCKVYVNCKVIIIQFKQYILYCSMYLCCVYNSFFIQFEIVFMVELHKI